MNIHSHCCRFHHLKLLSTHYLFPFCLRQKPCKVNGNTDTKCAVGCLMTKTWSKTMIFRKLLPRVEVTHVKELNCSPNYNCQLCSGPRMVPKFSLWGNCFLLNHVLGLIGAIANSGFTVWSHIPQHPNFLNKNFLKLKCETCCHCYHN